MSVRKPIDNPVDKVLTEADIKKLITKGAPVLEDVRSKENKNEWRMINLRISSKMLDRIDKALEDRVGITRTGWILEAIHNQLKELESNEGK